MTDVSSDILINSIREKVEAQTRLIKAFANYLQTLDEKLDSAIDLCIDKGMFTREEMETVWDKKRGLKIKDTAIEKGDIAWVTFETVMDNETKDITEKEIPVRVGANRIAFEEDLIGKMPHTRFSCTKIFKENGKKILFKISIGKVKTEAEKNA